LCSVTCAVTMPATPNSPQVPTETIRAFHPRENLRSAVRYSLRADVIFSWIASNGIEQQARGYTRDISPGGAYVFAETLPPIGRPLQLSIRLPMFAGETNPPTVQVRGQTLRADWKSGALGIGFAVRNEKVTLCRG
jgi:PilZ domain